MSPTVEQSPLHQLGIKIVLLHKQCTQVNLIWENTHLYLPLKMIVVKYFFTQCCVDLEHVTLDFEFPCASCLVLLIVVAKCVSFWLAC